MQALILNPNAARLRRQPDLIAEITRRASGHARVFVTADLAELSRAVRALAASDLRRVIFCGGDGTFMEGVSALHRANLLERRAAGQRVALAFLPAGTVATVARAFDQPGDLLEGVSLALSPEASFQAAPCLEVTSVKLGEALERRLGFIFGTGLVARFFQHYYATGADGLVGAAQVVARTLAGSFRADEYSRRILDPLPVEVAIDHHRLSPQAFSLVLCSVIADVGLGMRVCHRAAEDWQRPHVVASPLSPRRLGPQLHRVLRGVPLRGQGNFDDLASQLLLQFPDGNGPWVLDGDLLAAQQIQVTAGPTLWLLGSKAQ